MAAYTGYLTHLKTALVQALKETFDQDYPEPDFRDINVSIEYPIEPQHYPGIWVDYTDSDSLRVAGIDHHEFTEPGPDGYRRRYTRWRFAGYASFTVVAMSSLERDRLYDELVRCLAFTHESDQVPEFRNYVEDNEFIAMNFDFDEIEPRGSSVAPGTPWGTEELIYEVTLNMEVIGEFISDGSTGALVPLREIRVLGRAVLDADLSRPVESLSTQYPLGPADVRVHTPNGEWV